jgi:hypothetical protein
MSVGLKANVDGSGAIQVGGTDAITLSTGLNATFVQNANLPNTFGFKNRIINGAMVIDQRNAGAAQSYAAAPARTYCLDRYAIVYTANSKLTTQQNAGSVTPPAGYSKYLGVTSSSAYSVSASDYFLLSQAIEGQNLTDLAWGTASAATITLSFWVRSSLTGTFGGSLQNNAGDRSYPFTYTISAANTWEQKSITIAGDTSGTWLTTNSVGLFIWLGLGVGSTNSGTAGSWSGTSYYSATGATSVVGTNGATFFITGVQLERGSTATSFDVRSYGTELSLCQRYAYVWSTTSAQVAIASGFQYNATSGFYTINFPVQMRSSPTLNSVTAANWNNLFQGSQGTTSAISLTASNPNSAAITTTQTSSTGYSNILWSGTTSANMQFVSEL